MPGTSQSSPDTSSAMRMPASTGSWPVYQTVRPSNSKPATGEPSGASALYASIPALCPQRASGPALLARKEIEDVVVEDRPALAFEDDADGGELARVAQHAAGELERRTRQVE